MFVVAGLLVLCIAAGLISMAKRRTAGSDWAKRRPDDDVPGMPGPRSG